MKQVVLSVIVCPIFWSMTPCLVHNPPLGLFKPHLRFLSQIGKALLMGKANMQRVHPVFDALKPVRIGKAGYYRITLTLAGQ